MDERQRPVRSQNEFCKDLHWFLWQPRALTCYSAVLLPSERIDYIFFCFPQSTAESRISVLKDRIQWGSGNWEGREKSLNLLQGSGLPFLKLAYLTSKLTLCWSQFLAFELWLPSRYRRNPGLGNSIIYLAGMVLGQKNRFEERRERDCACNLLSAQESEVDD